MLSVLFLQEQAVLPLRGAYGLDLSSGVTVTLDTGDCCEALGNLSASQQQPRPPGARL